MEEHVGIVFHIFLGCISTSIKFFDKLIKTLISFALAGKGELMKALIVSCTLVKTLD